MEVLLDTIAADIATAGTILQANSTILLTKDEI